MGKYVFIDPMHENKSLIQFAILTQIKNRKINKGGGGGGRRSIHVHFQLPHVCLHAYCVYKYCVYVC